MHRHTTSGLLLGGLFLLTILLVGCGRYVDAHEEEIVRAPVLAGATSTPVPALPTPTLAPTLAATFGPADEPDEPEPTTLAATEMPQPAPTLAFATPHRRALVKPSPAPTLEFPSPTPVSVYSRTLQVPILMYHYVSDPPPGADIYRTDLSVAPDQFRAQMAYLAENGYTTIDLYDLIRAVTNKQELPPRAVILTFDDGYRDAYENAFPTLQEFGLKGTFFVVTELVDQGHPDYMSWAMIEEMAAAGHRIEPHSKTHPELVDRSREFLVWEILGSQETLEAHLGYKPRFFCYPGGRYDEATIQILRELDFWGAVTTAGGEWHGFLDRYEWSRVRMRYTTGLQDFAAFVDTSR